MVRKAAAKPSPAPRKPPAPQKTLTDIASKIHIESRGRPVHLLAVPWEAKAIVSAAGAKWHPELRQFLWYGTSLPSALKQYIPGEYSLEKYTQDEINGYLPPAPRVPTMKPRKHQVEAIKKVIAAAQAGYRGFIIADEVGLGKSIEALHGANETAKIKGFTSLAPAKLLIICPKAVIPHWRNTIKALNITHLRIVVINYDQSKKLLSIPSTATSAKSVRTKNKRIASSGKPNILWDIIIADEAHRLKNFETSQRAKAFDTIGRYSESHQKAPYIIWVSATIGQNPLELGYLAPLIGQMTGQASLQMKNWGDYLLQNGYHVVKGKVGFSWVKSKKEATVSQKKAVASSQKADVARLSQIIFAPTAPSIRRSPVDIAGWPSVQRIPTPVELTTDDTGLYKTVWLAFRSFISLNPRGKNPAGGLAAQLRFRQKASLIRAKETVDFAVELLDNGLQVAISVEFIESLDAMKQSLEGKGYSCVEISGRNSAAQESERLKFQKGQAEVAFFTVTEGISLHAGEQLADGSKASPTSRATIVHDVRYSAIQNHQIAGRTHRDGQNAIVYFMYAEETVEKKIVTIMLQRMANMSALSGDDSATVTEIENLLDFAV